MRVNSPILAADVGGTHVRAAVVSTQGKLTQQHRSQIELGDRDMTEKQLLDRLADFLSRILEEAPGVKTIGIGFPGFFVGNSGVLIASPNLPTLHKVDIARKLSRQLKVAVHVQNDALCAAIGEHAYGAGRGATNLLHVTLGTGIGGGLIINNAPYTGEGGMATEFGHLRVASGDAARGCGCGGSGCVEAHASATAIASIYGELTGIRTDSEDIYSRANQGDIRAAETIQGAGRKLGIALAQAIKLLDIHTITISGGLSNAWTLLYPPMLSTLNSELIPPLRGKISVLRSTLGDNAGILGAALIAQT